MYCPNALPSDFIPISRSETRPDRFRSMSRFSGLAIKDATRAVLQHTAVRASHPTAKKLRFTHKSGQWTWLPKFIISGSLSILESERGEPRILQDWRRRKKGGNGNADIMSARRGKTRQVHEKCKYHHGAFSGFPIFSPSLLLSGYSFL